MNKKQNWLELAEFFSVGSFFFGVITTAITKQMLFSLTPLTFVVFFNVINRQKHNYQANLYSQQAQHTQELYQDLITFSDDYKYQKLELEKLIEEAKKQRLEIEKDAKLEESRNKTTINSLINQLNSLSANQDKVSNYVYSELDKFIQSVENLQIKINQVSQIEASVNAMESRIQKIENNQSYYSHRQDNKDERNTQETKKKRQNNESDFNNEKGRKTSGKSDQGWGNWEWKDSGKWGDWGKW